MNNTAIRPNSPSWQAQSSSFNPPYPNQKFYNSPQYQQTNDQVAQYVRKLTATPNDRAEALYTLSLQRETIPDLAIYVWESPGTIAALLSEVISVYPQLTALTLGQGTPLTPLNAKLAGRVCHALCLFQCVAGHRETQLPFIRANLPMYLFPFLHTTNASRECECFKLTSLGIIGSLVKSESADIVEYLNQNEFVPLCLRILKFGQEMSKIVSAFILQKILSDQNGRAYIGASRERVETILKVLNLVIADLALNFNVRLSKNIVLSYQYLLKIPEAKSVIAVEMPYGEKILAVKISENCDQNFTTFFSQLASLAKPH